MTSENGASPVTTVIDLRGRDAAGLTRPALDGVLPRAALDVERAVELVRPICEDVRVRGGAAVREYTRRFDGVDLAHTRVPAEAITQALENLDPKVRDALAEAARRARVVHEAQLPDRKDTEPAPGLSVSTRFVPVRRAGVYVPGGLVAYPSSVVMNVVPAQAAGVGSIAVASPPQQEFGGLPHPAVLAACALLGIAEVHAVGGAQALAMFAYGTDECAPVDVITGPGNVYVAAAKRILQGQAGIDGENGPTEIAIIADHTADPAFVAADLIGQAEHDELAACLLITTDPGLPAKVDQELARQIPETKHRERVVTALTGQAAYVLTDDIHAARAVSDAWAPEHLEVQTEDAAKVAARDPQRRRDLRRPLLAGLAGRLPRRVQPRAAHRRHRPAHQRPVGLPLPEGRQRDRVRPRLPGERRAARRRPRRRRGPRRARQRRSASGCPPAGRKHRDHPDRRHSPFGMTSRTCIRTARRSSTSRCS